MKRILTLTLALILALSLTACGGSSIRAKEGKPASGFLWENDYSEITITGYEGSSNNLVIPAKINGKPVTKIKSGTFKGFKTLERVKIHGNIKSLSGVFPDCTGLKEVVLENGIEEVTSSFSNCSSLEKVNLPKSVKNISLSFSGCNSLKSVDLHDDIENISEAFKGCALTEIHIPSALFKTIKGADIAGDIKRSIKSDKYMGMYERISTRQLISSMINNIMRNCPSIKTITVDSEYLKMIFYPDVKITNSIYNKQKSDDWYDAILNEALNKTPSRVWEYENGLEADLYGYDGYGDYNGLMAYIESKEKDYLAIYSKNSILTHDVLDTENNEKLSIETMKHYFVAAPFRDSYTLEKSEIAVIESIYRIENLFLVGENYPSDTIIINGDTYAVSKTRPENY